jgi:hypothetical protein
MNHQAQTLNNCGPASLAILLGHYGIQVSQYEVQEWAATRPSPCYLSWYVADKGLGAEIYRFPLSRESRLTVVRTLLAHGMPLIVLQPLELGSDISHYRVMKGYDDVTEEFISDDPLLGQDHRLRYDTFARLLNRAGALFVPVFAPEQEPLVTSLAKQMYARQWTDFDGNSCASLNHR